ncbi:MAG: phage holin family protein [Opitutales bacterium]
MIQKILFAKVAHAVASGIYARERERRRAEALRTFRLGNLPKLALQIGLIVLGVLTSAWIFDGIDYGQSWPTLLLVAVVLSLLNGFIKPLLILFAFPFVVFTLGLGVALINALLLLLADLIIPAFEVRGFWNALGGAVVISAISFMGNVLVGTSSVRVRHAKQPGPNHSRIPFRPPSQRKQRPGEEVIDV